MPPEVDTYINKKRRTLVYLSIRGVWRNLNRLNIQNARAVQHVHSIVFLSVIMSRQTF